MADVGSLRFVWLPTPHQNSNAVVPEPSCSEGRAPKCCDQTLGLTDQVNSPCWSKGTQNWVRGNRKFFDSVDPTESPAWSLFGAKKPIFFSWADATEVTNSISKHIHVTRSPKHHTPPWNVTLSTSWNYICSLLPSLHTHFNPVLVTPLTTGNNIG